MYIKNYIIVSVIHYFIIYNLLLYSIVNLIQNHLNYLYLL